MAVPFSNTRLRVPKGFQNVLEGLAREVLRSQPENILSFSEAYFEELLRIRQETGYDDITLLGAKLEDRFYNNHSFKNPNVNTNNDEQQNAAVLIQSEYRRFAAKKEVDSLKEDEAATVIQASFRGHIERDNIRTEVDDEAIDKEITMNQNNLAENVQESEFVHAEEFSERGMDNNNEKTQEEQLSDKGDETTIVELQKSREIEDEVIDIDLEDPDVEKAALKIQSVFKGFKGRRLNKVQVRKESKEESIHVEESIDNLIGTLEVEDDKQVQELTDNDQSLKKDDNAIDIDLKDPDLAKAALKIQLLFRGFRIRKKKEVGQMQSLKKDDKDVDIDLKDPDLAKAALKIQLVFRGFRIRKKKEIVEVDTEIGEVLDEKVDKNSLVDDNDERSASKLVDENKSFQDEGNNDQEEKEVNTMFEEASEVELEAKNDNLVEEENDNVVEAVNNKELEAEEDNDVEADNSQFVEEEKHVEDEGFIANVEIGEFQQLENEDEMENISNLKDQETIEEKEIGVLDELITERNEITDEINEMFDSDTARKEENVEPNIKEVEENEESAHVDGVERFDDQGDMKEDVVNDVSIEQDNINLLSEEKENFDAELTEVDMIRDYENEDDTARDVDDEATQPVINDAEVIVDADNEENDASGRLDENTERSVLDTDVVDPEVNETSRNNDIIQEDDNESQQQLPKTHLEDTEETGDTEAQNDNTEAQNDNTARSEDVDDQA